MTSVATRSVPYGSGYGCGEQTLTPFSQFRAYNGLTSSQTYPPTGNDDYGHHHYNYNDNDNHQYRPTSGLSSMPHVPWGSTHNVSTCGGYYPTVTSDQGPTFTQKDLTGYYAPSYSYFTRQTQTPPPMHVMSGQLGMCSPTYMKTNSSETDHVYDRITLPSNNRGSSNYYASGRGSSTHNQSPSGSSTVTSATGALSTGGDGWIPNLCSRWERERPLALKEQTVENLKSRKFMTNELHWDHFDDNGKIRKEVLEAFEKRD